MSEHRHDHTCGPGCNHNHVHFDYPVIFSFADTLIFQKKVCCKSIQEALSDWIEEVKTWAKSNTCTIGHIKVFAEGQESLWLSSTGRSINVKLSAGWSELVTDRINLNVTAIIFGTSQGALDKVARLKLQECLARIN